MVSAGHSWKDIQDYTLSEIGVFLSATIKRRQTTQIQDLSIAWMGTHLSKEVLDSTISKMDNQSEKKSEPPPEVVKSEWKRLASFFRGLR